MGIVDWHVNDLSSEDRNIIRDMISIAIADNEFAGEEKKTIMEICQIEDISNVEIIDSIRRKDTKPKTPQTLKEKKNYILHLISVMSIDKKFPSLELHLIEIIAKKLGIPPLQIIAFVIEEIKDKNIAIDEGITIIDKFVHHLLTINS